mgnify:CR=1 FL=1
MQKQIFLLNVFIHFCSIIIYYIDHLKTQKCMKTKLFKNFSF